MIFLTSPISTCLVQKTPKWNRYRCWCFFDILLGLCHCLNHVLIKHLKRRFSNLFQIRMWTEYFYESHLTSWEHNQLNLFLYNKEYHQHTLSSTSSCPLELVLLIAPILPEICTLKSVPMAKPLQHRHSEQKYCPRM